ncbi:NHL repeat-containing protein [Portibacter marinus]|uniref:hypothetical protein n=1 Tax=Portibacter marinus TaxID=2898660 RepID=UPI001F3AD962|nr:hypothetical protein [Portibacter marinus]
MEPTQSLEPAFDPQARDNGNRADASDIEIKYHQFGLDHIAKYRIYIVKAERFSSQDLDFLQSLSNAHYVDAQPNEVIPRKGKRMPSELLDSDGDLIIEGRPYRAAIISLPKDPEVYLPSLVHTPEDLILSSNRIVCHHTKQLEGGSGELAMNKDGQLAMASYHIINDLSDGDFEMSHLIYIGANGQTTNSINAYPYLGGIDSDPQGNFYVSHTQAGQVLKFSSVGSSEVISMGEVELKKPEGIYLDGQGVLYIADREGFVIKVAIDGSASILAKVDKGIRGLTGDDSGNLYASINSEEGKIIKIDPNGEVETIANIPTYVPDDYLVPFIMWLGHLEFYNGKLYVAGTSTHRIYSVTMDGKVEVFAGTGERLLPYGDIVTADFNRPMGLEFSQDGQTLFVSGCEDIVPQHTQASTPSRIYQIKWVE